ncbi:MAG: FliH/SctL family protein [Xanthobacteraceae bacterium]
MTAPAKFMFDLDFTTPARPSQAAVVPLAVHEAALAEAEARGRQAGLVAAEAQERTRAERQRAAAFDRISAALTRLAGELPALAGRLETESVDVAIAVARQLAPALIAREPLAEVSALVAACLRELTAAPHVVIRLNEALYPTARERLAELARACGFDGRLVVLGEADIAPGDCQIEWADGGVIRERAAIEAAIAETVERYFAERQSKSSPGRGAGHG